MEIQVKIKASGVKTLYTETKPKEENKNAK
jgi:hypothetical protein